MNVPNRNLQDSYHLVADSAFPVVKEIMVPYKRYGGPLNDRQKKFNKHLSSKDRQILLI